ncbi:MAG TPA: ATPase, T2SS/T4P/T4SS family [Candidatus Saccharimonadales bacterium]|nr:ATPase, T2SS/T4P/T4SS family [Candidatus Saccharimonadales bacterium]
MVTSESAAIALADSSVAATAAERLLVDAIQNGAETLHLEPHEDMARVRYRIDGALDDWVHLSQHALKALLAHFKHRANVSPEERRWSQEGRFTLTVDGTPYTIKLTTLPLATGEKAVLRIFNSNLQTHSLAELGIWGDTRKRLNRTLAAEQGLIVVSGSQHSGVSTTIRSLLHALNKPSHSVVSIEDPVEHRLPGVHQLRVDRARGIDVSQGLDIALKGDANVILVSNLHGQQATNAALEATAKGKLLLAGMHTSSLLSTMQQLTAATHEQYLLAHHLQAVLHQQLVRRLCDNCKIAAKPDVAMLRKITSRTHITLATLQHFMEETAKHQRGAHIELYAADPDGCRKCHYTGFKGQIGLFELASATPQLQKRLAAHADPTTVLHHAVKEGMMPLLVDGFVKALCGLTTIEEVLHSYK